MSETELTQAHPRAATLSNLVNLGVELRFWVATCVTGLAIFSHRALSTFASAASAPCGSERGVHLPCAYAPSVTSEASVLSFVVVFLCTLGLYNLDGSLDAPARFERPEVRRRIHLLLTAVAFAGVCCLLPALPLAAALLIICGASLCALYALPFKSVKKRSLAQMTSRKQPRALKYLPGVKAPFVGFSVAFAVVWVPLFASEVTSAASWTTAVLLPAAVLTLALGVLCTVNAALFDVPDAEEDERDGVPTLALRAGASGLRTWAQRWSLGVLTGAGALLGASYAEIGLKQAALPSLWGLGLLAGILAAFSGFVTKHTSRRAVAWWVDGALLLPLLAQVLAS